MNPLHDKITLEEQYALLNYCIDNGIPLHIELKSRGYTYDNLRYEGYLSDDSFSNRFEPLDDIDKDNDEIPAISFFSGAGGLNIGFEYAGFNNIASIEYNEVFCNTLRRNSPHKLVIGPPDFSGDVSKREEISLILKDKLGINKNFEGCFHGGPPCQPFSIASNQRFSKQDGNFKRRGFDDEEKGTLLFDYLWFIEEYLPRAFFIENVSGISELDSDNIIQDSFRRLENLGYSITEPRVVNATHYGVPQNRYRWIIIGVRGNTSPQYPRPSSLATSCYGVFDKEIEGVPNHLTREHSAESVRRYMKLGFGNRDQLGRVDRLNPFLPSKTVIAGGIKGGGRSHLHPYIPRTLSVRESARLQTFPDEYIFTGSTARQFTQVGNAVPPILAYKFAKTIKKHIWE